MKGSFVLCAERRSRLYRANSKSQPGLGGRDPNSYTGIFWVLGRYDRPWAVDPAGVWVDPLYELGEHGAKDFCEQVHSEIFGPLANKMNF